MLWGRAGISRLYLHMAKRPDEVSPALFRRLPQENQSAETLREQLPNADVLLAETREFWRNWKPLGPLVEFRGRTANFLLRAHETFNKRGEIKK